MAEMRFLGACALFNKQLYGKTHDLFIDSKTFHRKALDLFEARKSERTAVGVHTMLAYANVLRSYGVLL